MPDESTKQAADCPAGEVPTECRGGDQIQVGNITGSTGVAVGRGARATVNQAAEVAALACAFDEIRARLDALEGARADDVADAKATVAEIEQQVAGGAEVEEGWLARRFRNLARTGPDILDVVTATLLNPAVGAATVVRKVAERARVEAGLAPVG